jgi:hypothetical protein
MAVKLVVRAAISVLLLVCIGICWFVIASDYSDAAASGTYRFAAHGMRSTLVLRPEHSFVQEVTDSSGTQRAEGTWRRVGMGGVSFSRDFLIFPGQQRSEDGTAFSDMQRRFGVFISLALRTYHVVWYSRADRAVADQVAGRYQKTDGSRSTTLVLNPNNTFDEIVAGSTPTVSAKGTWTIASNREVVFSKEFIKPSGQPLASYETARALDPRGTQFLQIVIAADQDHENLSYYKQQLPWQ